MGDKILVGTRKGLLILARDGGEWRIDSAHFEAIPVVYAMHDRRTGTLWASLDHGHWGGKLQRSHDGGASWQEVEAPKYPEGAKCPPDFTTPATTSYIWIIEPGGADEPNRLYVGTEPGGLFVSGDGGDSFQLNESLWNDPGNSQWFGGGRDYPGICAIQIDPRDSRRITVGISVGGVYVSEDGGKSWQVRNRGLYADYLPEHDAEVGQDPHIVLASPSNPDVLWQQNHCGIFRSSDAGRQWQDISDPEGPAGFGFALALDAQDENVAWVAPAVSAEYRVPVERALVICRSEDGGQSWQSLRKGLPQQHCYDLVFRHGLDAQGDSLAFGTTAGNFYVSDDRGDSWRCLVNNLAVVYSVRYM
ncbi:MAG: glycosyl hydrolase [Chloroflexi bacterium]|nr:glycosyl hydrolase [Chloroflexota bacterium]